MAQRQPRLQPFIAQDPIARYDPLMDAIDAILDRFEVRLTNAITAVLADVLTPHHRATPDQLLYSEEEAAKVLGMSRSWVSKMGRKGLLPRRQLGKNVSYHRSDIERIARDGLPPEGGA